MSAGTVWPPLGPDGFKPGSKARRFVEMADVDWEDGFSRWVYVDELPDDMRFGNGGDWCRSDGRLGRIFNIDRHRETGRIVAVKLEGYKKTPDGKPIPKWVRRDLSAAACAVLAVSHGECEIDHKDGRKDLPDTTNVDASMFQPLSKAANVAKRQHCKKCKETGLRFDATRLGYSVPQWKGGREYKGSCVGCFWYDPQEFNAQVSADFKKTK
ncbi:hypothetical protein CKO28_14205 [Rhodovibrio sodomensis]|uniref:Restriction endonuclease n=1 Tax=Rhodovibrio sodomensis TaxID=1088 RepID=A0ABS1DGR3_9PROT|nr:hypothetical protein [Rhodovibrio sodomensis]MBK1669186.1 hypothetical protein [Rhodovibrio sodomensis]